MDPKRSAMNLPVEDDSYDYSSDDSSDDIFYSFDEVSDDGHVEFWDPFPDVDANPSDLKAGMEQLLCCSSWDRKLSLIVHKILRNYLQEGISAYDYDVWPEQELKKILLDTQRKLQGKKPSTTEEIRDVETRYFCTAGVDGKECDHDEGCLCYFQATFTAGIPGFPTDLNSGQDRKDALIFMRNLITKLLILLVESAMEVFDTRDREEIPFWIQYLNPNRQNNEGQLNKPKAQEESDIRFRYLIFDTVFQRLVTKAAKGNFPAGENSRHDWQNDAGDNHNGGSRQPGTQIDRKYDLKALYGVCSTLGRRALALEVCISGTGFLFAKKEPIQFIGMSDLMNDFDDLQTDATIAVEKYRRSSPRGFIEKRYPTRVINTHTLDFEEDQMLFRESYAILSHTWKGREVTYATAPAALAEYKATAIIRSKILRMKWRLGRSKNLVDRVKIGEEMKALQAELHALENTNKTSGGADLNGHKTAKVQILDAGVVKLRRAIDCAKELGYTYLWVDSCCIDKPNNTELVEAISSMGDWYENASVCLVYLDDFDGKQLPHNKAYNTRWATRGWTLQEIVLCQNAVFYNHAWEKIADSRHEGEVSKEVLAKICRVPKEILFCGGKPNVPASLVLQLAAKRKTFKPEDRAYSLMGILGIRMRADYGEGRERAISRLFEAVIRTTRDVSIFNWSGPYCGNRNLGRSMYPTDFDSYKFNDFYSYIEDEDDASYKQAYNLSPITIGPIGIHARFDICEIKKIVIEESNEKTLDALNRLELSAASKSRRDMKSIDTDCTVLCDMTFNSTIQHRETVCVLTSLVSLRAILNGLLDTNTPASSRWVLARFSGLDTSEWFLCEIQHTSETNSEGMFLDVIKSSNWGGERTDTRKGGVNAASFMLYLENSGFSAKRVATDRLDQFRLKHSREHIKNAFMWVG